MIRTSNSIRKISFFALAVMLGIGAFTSLYAPPPKKYTSFAICYYGNYPMTYTSYVSQADADAQATAKYNESPNDKNFIGPCPPGQGPSTPGA